MATITPAQLPSSLKSQDKGAARIQAQFGGRSVSKLESKSSSGEPICGICKESLLTSEKVVQMTCKEGHVLHPTCALHWALVDICNTVPCNSCPHDREGNTNPYNLQKMGENPAFLGRTLIVASQKNGPLQLFLERFTDNPHLQHISKHDLEEALINAFEDLDTLQLFSTKFRRELNVDHMSASQLGAALVKASKNRSTFDLFFDLFQGNLNLEHISASELGVALTTASKKRKTLELFIKNFQRHLNVRQISPDQLGPALVNACENQETLELFMKIFNGNPQLQEISGYYLGKALLSPNVDIYSFFTSFKKNKNFLHLSESDLRGVLIKASTYHEIFKSLLKILSVEPKSVQHLSAIDLGILLVQTIVYRGNLELFLKTFSKNPSFLQIDTYFLKRAFTRASKAFDKPIEKLLLKELNPLRKIFSSRLKVLSKTYTDRENLQLCFSTFKECTEFLEIPASVLGADLAQACEDLETLNLFLDRFEGNCDFMGIDYSDLQDALVKSCKDTRILKLLLEKFREYKPSKYFKMSNLLSESLGIALCEACKNRTLEPFLKRFEGSDYLNRVYPYQLGEVLTSASENIKMLELFLKSFGEKPYFLQLETSQIGDAFTRASENKDKLAQALLLKTFSNRLESEGLSREDLIAAGRETVASYRAASPTKKERAKRSCIIS